MVWISNMNFQYERNDYNRCSLVKSHGACESP